MTCHLYGSLFLFSKGEDYTYAQKIKIPLPSGSLLIMKGSTQADWQVTISSFGFNENEKFSYHVHITAGSNNATKPTNC